MWFYAFTISHHRDGNDFENFEDPTWVVTSLDLGHLHLKGCGWRVKKVKVYFFIYHFPLIDVQHWKLSYRYCNVCLLIKSYKRCILNYFLTSSAGHSTLAMSTAIFTFLTTSTNLKLALFLLKIFQIPFFCKYYECFPLRNTYCGILPPSAPITSHALVKAPPVRKKHNLYEKFCV